MSGIETSMNMRIINVFWEDFIFNQKIIFIFILDRHGSPAKNHKLAQLSCIFVNMSCVRHGTDMFAFRLQQNT